MDQYIEIYKAHFTVENPLGTVKLQYTTNAEIKRNSYRSRKKKKPIKVEKEIIMTIALLNSNNAQTNTCFPPERAWALETTQSQSLSTNKQNA